MVEWLERFKATDRYEYFKRELEYLRHHDAIWSSAPFPVNFVTVDSVVVQSAHVLMIRRRTHPGKGLYALPGGYLGQDEEPLAGAIRELKEETQIVIPHDELMSSFKEAQLFAHPNRSQRKRIMTVAHLFILPDGPLHKVKGADDADKAFWMPLSDIYRNEEKLFEDHGHIIRKFTSKF